ncbi:MAG: hypothetical protein ACJ8F1_16465 [Polyangia bacterium]
MLSTPYARLDVSKVGLLVGLAVLAFGVYASVSYFRSGGHAMTALRALAALPVGVTAIVLSFSTVCSGCGARLEGRRLSTAAARAADVQRAAEAVDAAAVARALAGAANEPGPAQVRLEACPQCRRLVRVQTGSSKRMLSGDTAVALAELVVGLPQPN